MHVRTTASELAQWLERAGGVWHVEGESRLAASLPLPSPASALVDVLRRRAGALAVLAPETSALTELGDDAPVTARELSSAAHVVDGQRVFQLAWVHEDGVVQDSWLLAEQHGPAPGSSDDNAAARSVVAAFRAAVSSSRR
ncbi:MAG TPA: hypothetical protein VLT33_19960 [Labilithrix sp.]|nr:hypothetical protein [Labilithrix sp.]